VQTMLPQTVARGSAALTRRRVPERLLLKLERRNPRPRPRALQLSLSTEIRLILCMSGTILR